MIPERYYDNYIDASPRVSIRPISSRAPLDGQLEGFADFHIGVSFLPFIDPLFRPLNNLVWFG